MAVVETRGTPSIYLQRAPSPSVPADAGDDK
jgi:hypothetical protein